MKIGKYYIEFIFNLKHWGSYVGFFERDENWPYFRFYFLFIFIGEPYTQD